MKFGFIVFLIFIFLLGGCKSTNENNPVEMQQQTQTETTENTNEDEWVVPQMKPSDRELETRTVTYDSPYHNTNTEVQILGFETYDSIETENFVDTPQKGNCYIVLYLAVKNLSDEVIYMHPDDLTAKLDGQEIQHTFLLNNPKEYSSFFNNVWPSVYPMYGYIVWEVPKNWSKIELEFRQWEHTDYVTLDMTLTPDDYYETEKVKDLQI